MAENRETPLSTEVPIREGQGLTGPLFGDPLPLETGGSYGVGACNAFLAFEQMWRTR